MWTLGVQILFAAITGQSPAAFPPKPVPSVIQTAPHFFVHWRPASEWGTEVEKVWDWTKPSEVLENWRDLTAKRQIPHEDRYLQRYEDDLDVLVNALKKSDKSDKDRPHLCRAIWRRKRARRRHVDRQKKLECCEEERAPPSKPKSKHFNWERVCRERGGPECSLIDFHVAIFEFPSMVQGRTLRQAEDENRKWCVGLWHTRVADTPVFQCDVELLTECIKKLRKHKKALKMGSPQRFSINSVPLSSHSSHRPSRTCSHHWTSRHSGPLSQRAWYPRSLFPANCQK